MRKFAHENESSSRANTHIQHTHTNLHLAQARLFPPLEAEEFAVCVCERNEQTIARVSLEHASYVRSPVLSLSSLCVCMCESLSVLVRTNE